MPFLFGRAYRRFGKNYFLLYVAFEFVSAFIVCLATVGLFSLYTDLVGSEFWTIAAFAEVCVVAQHGVHALERRRSGCGRSSTGWRATAMRARRLARGRGGSARADAAGRLAAVPPDRRPGRHLRDDRGRPPAATAPSSSSPAPPWRWPTRRPPLLLLRAVPAPGRGGHRRRAAARLQRRAAGRAAALEAARRAAADQRDHGRGGERAVHRRNRAARGPRARRGGGGARGVHDLARADAARHALGLAAGGRAAEGHRGGEERRPRRARPDHLRRRDGPARGELQRDDGGALRARGAARGVRRVRRPRRGASACSSRAAS